MDLNEQADRDFNRARRRAFLRRVGAYLRRDPASNRLLSFEEVRGAVGALEGAYVGMRVVPVEKIVGSVGRHRDFDRAFLPSTESVEGRWKQIDRAMIRAEELPAVSLYKMGDAYFVNDGNHRVSVARYHGVESIDAEVVTFRSPRVSPTGILGALPNCSGLMSRIRDKLGSALSSRKRSRNR